MRRLTGLLLTMAVLITRLPFISRMLYEFDSIDFAVATFRFSIEQVTPHFPGYVLHILFAKFILLFISDVNLAFVWISILLSIGSVLLLWRAGASLRGERVGLITALLWLLTPILWFHGEVATSYVYEAFFASAFLYLGMSLLHKPDRKWFVYLLFITLSLATGARQSSIVFFTPCIIYILWKTRQPFRIWVSGVFTFCIVTATWLGVLFYFSGGISQYFAQAGKETVYRSQSILFGNSFNAHVIVIAKVIVYLAMASLPFILIAVALLISNWKRSIAFVEVQISKPTFRFTFLVALPAFLFYIGIYFMKAGYLLNILPTIVLASAVLLDQMAIWNAEKMKKASSDKLLLTRPIITKAVIRNVAFIIAFDLMIFFFPFSWLCDEYIDNAFTGDSLNKQSQNAGLFLNRLFSFSNVHAVASMDRLHSEVAAALKSEALHPNDLVILDTWWHRWGYYYQPQSTIYDIRDFPQSDSLWVGVSQNFVRKGLADTLIAIPHDKKVLLLLRDDHQSFESITKQVHVERINLPKYLDIYRITDQHFSLKWKNVRYVKE